MGLDFGGLLSSDIIVTVVALAVVNTEPHKEKASALRSSYSPSPKVVFTTLTMTVATAVIWGKWGGKTEW